MEKNTIQTNPDNNRKYLDGLYNDKDKDKKKKDGVVSSDAMTEQVEGTDELQYFTE